MIGGALDAVKIGAGVVLGLGLFGAPLYLYGKSVGKGEAAIVALGNSVEALRDRGLINEQISTSDVSAMCRHLGMLGDDHGECVRRMAEANAATGNGRLHHAE